MKSSFDATGHAMYLTLAPFSLSIGLSVVVVVCLLADKYEKGPVGRVLEWPGWESLSRLTLGAYLVHPMLISIYYRYEP